MHETELTRAARSSVDNADTITEAEIIHEEDFISQKSLKKSQFTKKEKSCPQGTNAKTVKRAANNPMMKHSAHLIKLKNGSIGLIN